MLPSQGGAFTYQMRDQISALLASAGIMTQGNIYWVRPYTGLGAGAGGDGKSPASAFRTLAEGLAAATADQNDVVAVCAESNTAAKTTDYQAAQLDWNKDGVHLIGVNAGAALSPRSRVAFAAAYNSASPLFKLSANDCLVQGLEVFMGVAGTTPLGSMTITGVRNHIVKSHISGFGGAASCNDISGAYSLYLNGAKENLFEDCVFGHQTLILGAQANSQILTAGATMRNIFKRCRFLMWTSSATNHLFLRMQSGGYQGFIEFEDCRFINETTLAGGTSLTDAFSIPTGQMVLLSGNTQLFGGSYWCVTGAGNCLHGGVGTTTSTGVAATVAHS